MKLAIHISDTGKNLNKILDPFFIALHENGIEYILSESFMNYPSYQINAKVEQGNYFRNQKDLIDKKVNFLFSIGGDGTFLDALLYVRDSGIPIIGMNAGRLGFLSNIQIENINYLLKSLINNDFYIDKRSILQFESNKKVFGEDNIALNDFTIHKRDSSSLTAISTYLNGKLFNIYWGDGIIISTPTGSTAYSLSCGGPIVFPESNTFIITPVAPHNLNVRPVIVPDDTILSFEIKGREGNFLVSLDSRYKIIDQTYTIKISKAPFVISTVRLMNQTFSQILREKLIWGVDNRNIK